MISYPIISCDIIPYYIISSHTTPHHTHHTTSYHSTSSHTTHHHTPPHHLRIHHIISHHTTLRYTTQSIKRNKNILAISTESLCLMLYHPIAPPINSQALIDDMCKCRKCDIKNWPDEMIECIQSGPNTHWARNKPPRAENRCWEHMRGDLNKDLDTNAIRYCTRCSNIRIWHGKAKQDMVVE